MTTYRLYALCLALFLSFGIAHAKEKTPAPAPNGIAYPKHWRHWPVIGVSQRSDKNSLRVILGNPVAVAAARQGRTQPWPEGTILAKIAWEHHTHPLWPAAQVPGTFTHVEFMIKDRKRFTTPGGWGYARWKGETLEPYGDNAAFDRECQACHQQAASQDYVFTVPATLPAE